MTTEYQDRIWSCLNNELRDKFREVYHDLICDLEYKAALEDVFGKHNIISYENPDEMLVVKRADVITQFNKLHKNSYTVNSLQIGLNAFRNLFGSKCLSDEDLAIIDKYKAK